MNKIKFFVLGFISCFALAVALSYIAFINITHSLLVSKINTEVTFIEAATMPDGIEKLRSLVSINLSNDYCAAKNLGDHVLTRNAFHESQVYEKVENYIEKYNLNDSCFN